MILSARVSWSFEGSCFPFCGSWVQSEPKRAVILEDPRKKSDQGASPIILAVWSCAIGGRQKDWVFMVFKFPFVVCFDRPKDRIVNSRKALSRHCTCQL